MQRKLGALRAHGRTLHCLPTWPRIDAEAARFQNELVRLESILQTCAANSREARRAIECIDNLGQALHRSSHLLRHDALRSFNPQIGEQVQCVHQLTEELAELACDLADLKF